MWNRKINPYNLSIDNPKNVDDKLNTAANLSQFYSLFLLLRDASNNQIIKELNNQNEAYLKKIIAQNEEIIKMLKERIDKC